MRDKSVFFFIFNRWKCAKMKFVLKRLHRFHIEFISDGCLYYNQSLVINILTSYSTVLHNATT